MLVVMISMNAKSHVPLELTAIFFILKLPVSASLVLQDIGVLRAQLTLQILVMKVMFVSVVLTQLLPTPLTIP